MPGFCEGDSYQVIWLLRRLFRSLAEKSGSILADLDISAADRAVLEFLHPDVELTVPGIAARYQVSRQHVQVTVNSLLQKDLVEVRDNPRHKRSPLVRLSDHGRQLFTDILERDRDAVEELFEPLPARNIAITRRTLQSLLDRLLEEPSS